MFSETKKILKTLLDRKKDPFIFVPKTPKNQLAYLISRVLGPTPLICIMWLIITLKSGVGVGKAIWVYPLIFLVTAGIPIIIFTYLVLSGKVKNVEWSDIKDREKYMPPIVLFSLTTLAVLIWLLTSSTMFHLTLVFETIAVAMIVIYSVFKFKASMHMMFATITFAGIVLFFGINYLWIFLLLLPIMWARRTLKVHTVPELLVGFFVPALIMIASLLIFGWPNIQ